MNSEYRDNMEKAQREKHRPHSQNEHKHFKNQNDYAQADNFNRDFRNKRNFKQYDRQRNLYVFNTTLKASKTLSTLVMKTNHTMIISFKIEGRRSWIHFLLEDHLTEMTQIKGKMVSEKIIATNTKTDLKIR